MSTGTASDCLLTLACKPPGRLVWLLISLIVALFIGAMLSRLPGSGAFMHEYYWESQKGTFLWLNGVLGHVPERIWYNITCLGDATVLIALLSPLAVLYPRAWFALFSSIPLAALFSTSLKHLFAMPRPAVVLEPNTFHVIGSAVHGYTSLPSGHSITVFAAASALLATLCSGSCKHRFAWAAVILLLASTIAVSRVAVGAHWPLDLLVGALLGWLAGLSGAWIAGRYWHRVQRSTSLGTVRSRFVLMAGLLILSGIMFIRQGESGFCVFGFAASSALAVVIVLWMAHVEGKW